MKDYSKAYKAYDIRAVYDDPIDNTFVYSLGKGIGKYLLKTVGEDTTFLFGSDVREANNALIYRFLKGLEEGGCVNYVGVGMPVESVDEKQQQLRGVASTAMCYYFTKHSFDMGMIFTASHNPPEYVGMKIVNNESLLIPSNVLSAMVEEYEPVADTIDEEDFERVWQKAMGDGNMLHEIIETKIQALSDIYGKKFSNGEHAYKIVVDFSNGAAVGYEKLFLEEIVAPLGHELIYINDMADSLFRSHASDTTNPHDYIQLGDAVREVEADFGIMFDGDGDRLGFVDEKGAFISGDLIVAILAESILKSAPTGQSVIYDVTSTNAIIEVIENRGGVAIPSRVGHRYIKELFKEHAAIFGGELSGHLFFPEIGGFENPLMALVYVLQELQEYTMFSEMVDDICVYYKPPLVNYTVEDKEVVLERIKEYYKDIAVLDFTDGIRVNFSDWRFLVRPSNTEPKLRFYIETVDKNMWKEKVKEVEKLIEG